jgi:Fe-S-cluster containining protein
MNQNNRYANYTQLLAKVDLMFNSVVERNPGQFQCQRSCYACCQPGLTISNIEATRIREWLSENADVFAKIRDSSTMMNDKNYCPLLDKSGLCSIYEVRPMICRSHGMPVSWGASEGGSQEERDVCPLNFEGVNLQSLSKMDVLSLDKLNVLLSLINRQFDEENAGSRLELKEILKDLS